jgi:membrane protein implicated in regulation of membrane protease activity
MLIKEDTMSDNVNVENSSDLVGLSLIVITLGLIGTIVGLGLILFGHIATGFIVAIASVLVIFGISKYLRDMDREWE